MQSADGALMLSKMEYRIRTYCVRLTYPTKYSKPKKRCIVERIGRYVFIVERRYAFIT